MKMRLGSLWLSVVLLHVPSLSMGQGEFGHTANEPFSGGVRVVNALPVTKNERSGIALGERSVVAATKQIRAINSIDLAPVLRQLWQQRKLEIERETEAFLRERDIGGGFRTSANHLALSSNGQLFAGWDGHAGFKIRAFLPANKLSTRIRIPGPSAQSSDPALTLPFDLEVVMDVDLVGTQLVARSSTVAVKAHQPDGRNLTGDATVALAKLVKFFGGPDLVGALVKQINGQKFSITNLANQELAKLNPALAAAAKPATVRPGFDTARRSILLTIERAQSGPIVH